MLKTKVAQTDYQLSGLGGTASDVNWNDANAFATWLNQQDGKIYHLPSEAQWEYVYENPGLVEDMSGREWVQDWHGIYPHNDLTDPLGPVKGVLKVIRGDGQNRWSLPVNARYSPWYLGEAGACSFRLVMEYDPPEEPDISTGPYCQAAIKQSTTPALQGPDPDVPYFTVRFSMPIPPDNIEDGIASILGCCPSTMHHSHSPGFEIMPNGDALAVWFTAHASEYADDVRFVQARLRYGSDQWDMPELFWDMKGMNDESGLLWREDDGTVHFFGGGRIDDSARRPFVMALSTDNGATWGLKRPYFPVSATNFTAQPCENAFRRDSNIIYTVTDGEGADSILWESTDNGLTWYDTGGRTVGRHSTIVPLLNGTTLLSLGGKNSNINNFMPQCFSSDWGRHWINVSATPFSHLGSNQRPCVIRLANGKLAFCGDAQNRDGSRPSGVSYSRGAIVAISDDDGVSWYIKNLPVTLPHESDLDDGTIGYSTIRQAPNGTIHILSTMTHPCLHYELNENWVFSAEGDIPPETTGGSVNSYSEYYPGGALKATWSARTCPNGRYLLNGTEISYYEDGTKEHQVTYSNVRKSGVETFLGPDGTKIWSWGHNSLAHTSIWKHYWSNGFQRIESRWNSYPQARDLARNFSGYVADGVTYHWNKDGSGAYGYNFDEGEYTGSASAPDAQPLCWGCPYWALGDINGDGYINVNDFVPIINYFGQSASAYPCADLDEDGYININDIVPIINNFGGGDGIACP